MNQFKDVSAQKTAEPPYLRKRRNKFKQRQEDMPYVGHLMINNDGQQIIQPMYQPNHRGTSMPLPMPVRRPQDYPEDLDEEDKENVSPLQYYPTCNCHHNYANMYINPHGYYYAPASLYFSPRSDDSDHSVNKRIKKHRRKSKNNDEQRGHKNYHRHDAHDKYHGYTGTNQYYSRFNDCSRSAKKQRMKAKHRVKSAYINNRIPLHIVPTKIDNRMFLHAYPINYPYQYNSKEDSHCENEDPVYVKKLEYSGDKIQSPHNKPKSSDHKKPRKDRSVEVENRSKDYFQINRARKNTLSGHK